MQINKRLRRKLVAAKAEKNMIKIIAKNACKIYHTFISKTYQQRKI